MKAILMFLALLISIPVLAQPKDAKQPESDRSSMDTAKEKAKQTGAETKRATKNAALTGKVKSALAADVGLKTMKIDVDSSEGVVTLKGRVDSADTRQRAERTAKKVSGVTSVHNELQVRSGG